MAASLWLLEAKAFQQEDRSEAARSVHFWLRPGGYVVGRQGADIVVEEDKSISRRHAELTVPRAVQGGDPHIVVKGWFILDLRVCMQRSQSSAASEFSPDAGCLQPSCQSRLLSACPPQQAGSAPVFPLRTSCRHQQVRYVRG